MDCVRALEDERGDSDTGPLSYRVTVTIWNRQFSKTCV